MAFELHRYHGFPAIAGSNILPRTAVTLATAAAAERGVVPVASSNQRPFGVTHATALRTEGVDVHEQGAVVKVAAAASLGHGAEVGIASGASGGFQPLSAGSAVWSVGQAVQSAVAGDVFSLYVNPRQIA